MMRVQLYINSNKYNVIYLIYNGTQFKEELLWRLFFYFWKIYGACDFQYMWDVVRYSNKFTLIFIKQIQGCMTWGI